VAIVAGSLGHGGAEKQMLCLVRALNGRGADVRVYSLEREGFYGNALRSLGTEPIWIGEGSTPVARLSRLTGRLRRFAPDVIQAGHSFVNLYVGLAARLLRTLGLGALRSSLPHCQRANGRWTRWLMTVPTALLTNSETARRELLQTSWVPEGRVFVLPNAIDLADYRRQTEPLPTVPTADASCTAIVVGRMVRSKRVDVFLRGLAVARRTGAKLRGLVVGDGPELPQLRSLASELGLSSGGVTFLGERDDVPALLRGADVLVLCSEDEGFPNVILEASAAGLPILTTPAGDAARMVQPGRNGWILPFGDAQGLAGELIRLAGSPELRAQLGSFGRDVVAPEYDLLHLASRLQDIYASVARLEGREETLEAVFSA
jgi:glycosyltransferase involved in cell wall biosynthesis